MRYWLHNLFHKFKSYGDLEPEVHSFVLFHTKCILVVPSNDRGTEGRLPAAPFPRTICWFIVTRSLDSYISPRGEIYSPAFISPWVIYARPILYLCHVRVATRASHCRCIEGFRSITLNAYRTVVRVRSCWPRHCKKSFPSKKHVSRGQLPENLLATSKLLGELSAHSEGVIDLQDDLWRGG